MSKRLKALLLAALCVALATGAWLIATQTAGNFIRASMVLVVIFSTIEPPLYVPREESPDQRVLEAVVDFMRWSAAFGAVMLFMRTLLEHGSAASHLFLALGMCALLGAAVPPLYLASKTHGSMRS